MWGTGPPGLHTILCHSRLYPPDRDYDFSYWRVCEGKDKEYFLLWEAETNGKAFLDPKLSLYGSVCAISWWNWICQGGSVAVYVWHLSRIILCTGQKISQPNKGRVWKNALIVIYPEKDWENVLCKYQWLVHCTAYRSWIHERTISLRVLRLKVWLCMYKAYMYITNQFQTTFAGGGGGIRL